jgi:hypothetical protein
MVTSETQGIHEVRQGGLLAQFSPTDQVALLRGDVLLKSQTGDASGAVTC